MTIPAPSVPAGNVAAPDSLSTQGTIAPDTTTLPAPVSSQPADDLPPPSRRDVLVRDTAFVSRCAISGLIGYLVPVAMGFANPVWSATVAVNIARNPLNKTSKQTKSHIIGTLFGALVGIIINIIAQVIYIPIPVQIVMSVSICAIATLRYSVLKRGMWTCLVVLIHVHDGASAEKLGIVRTFEIVLGCLIGASVHYITYYIVQKIIRVSSADEKWD